MRMTCPPDRPSRRHRPAWRGRWHSLAVAVALVASPAAVGEVAPATPPPLGDIDFPTSAERPAAQERFERGVAALHSFWYDEAADAFRDATALEPGFALAAWGEAMTCNHPIWNQVDADCGRTALARLGATAEERAAKAPTARERAYLAAVETLFVEDDPAVEAAAGNGKAARDAAYSAAMSDLVAAHPDDHEAAAFHALALQGLVYGGHTSDAERMPTLMRSAALLERLFDRAPTHPGVLHYLIHAYDDPVHAPLGLRAAELYAETAPAAHHALHMPSHIFLQLGRWDETVASNEDAWAASVAWQERRGHGVDKRDFHSLSWQLYAELQQGRRAAAAETLARARLSLTDGGHPRVAAAIARMEARWTVETGTAPPIGGEHAAPAAGGQRSDPADHQHAAHAESDGSVLFARGLIALDAGDGEAARRFAAQLSAVDDLAEKVMAAQLEGLALRADGEIEPALDRLRAAVSLETTLPPPSGPPEPPQPAHELLGEVLLDLDRPADAAEAFAIALHRTPRRPAALLGAARAARQLGDETTAARHYRELAAIWAAADEDHPGVAEARSVLDPARGGD